MKIAYQIIIVILLALVAIILYFVLAGNPRSGLSNTASQIQKQTTNTSP